MSHFNRFMKFFDAPNVFQLFGDKADLPPMILVDPDPNELVRLNAKGYGIFITVNKTDGGRKAKDIKKVRYVFSDMDGVSPSKLMDYMPSFVVQSSTGKYHGYFKVDADFPLEGFKGVQKAIAHCFGSDPSVNDLPRVLRVPGFYHQKGEPCKTELVWVNDSQRPLSYAECCEKFPPPPVKKWSAKKTVRQNSEQIDVGATIPELLERYGWTHYHGQHFTRPGKDHGVSGSILESGMFYVFTSETCLKPNSVADAFELVAMYDFGGDKSAAAKKYYKKA